MIVELASIKVDDVNMEEALHHLEGYISQKTPRLIVTPNPEMIVSSERDRELRTILNNADLRLPDGISMVVVSRLLARPLRERVTGIDFLLRAAELSARRGYKLFLLGSAPGVAEAAADQLVKTYPDLKICGTHHGYFKPEDEPGIITQIQDARPDILFAGLGAGRQEKWLHAHLKEMNVPAAMGVGGSLDVIAGIKKRAPRIIQMLYIEWLYRLITEPWRWKRQLALPQFLWLTLIWYNLLFHEKN